MISPASCLIKCMRRRAALDLLQPDSPTMPTVSPLSTANDTSSTARTVLRALKRSPRRGKCLVSPFTSSNGCATLPPSTGLSISTGRIVSLMALVPYVHGAAQAVAQQIEADRHREDHGAGQRCDPWIDVDRGAQRVEHQAPFRLRRLGAEAEERLSGRENHRHRDQTGGVDKDWTEHVAQDMHAHDGE